MTARSILSLLLIFSAFSASAQENTEAQVEISAETAVVTETTNKNTTYLICKNNAAVRTIRVHKQDNGACETTYTKEGVDQSVGKSWAVSRCSKVLGNIRTNLEKANWKCKDISEARVSSSEE